MPAQKAERIPHGILHSNERQRSHRAGKSARQQRLPEPYDPTAHFGLSRINQSGDDAAGLAIANKFRSDIAELSQGVRNANDGVAQLQIMDGGIGNISKMLDRLKTLATQSASSTFTGDRTVLNKEYQTLVGEIDRQAQGVGLSSGGRFATSLGVFIGGGTDRGWRCEYRQRVSHTGPRRFRGGYQGAWVCAAPPSRWPAA